MNAETRIEVPAELFAPAESSHFQGQITLPKLETGPDCYEFSEPLSWQATISNTGDALLVTGSVQGVASTACARCLDEFTIPLDGEIEGYFLLSHEQDAPEDMDDDEFDVLPENHIIDFEPLIIAALLLEFPLVPLCDEDCKGLCPTCGANLNEGACECTHTSDDDTPPNPFAVLKDFPFDKE